MVLTIALKNFILDVAEVLDLHLSLLGEFFLKAISIDTRSKCESSQVCFM